MKRSVIAVILLVLFSAPALAGGGLDSFLDDLNIQARVDMTDFAAKLSTQFGVPLPQVQVVIETVGAPADAFMCFQLGHMARTPYQRAVDVYQTKKGQGWGVIAKSLGIKPGSPEFHALKRGDFVFNGEPQEAPGKGKGKGKGKNK
jgi:hypothetical protein